MRRVGLSEFWVFIFPFSWWLLPILAMWNWLCVALAWFLVYYLWVKKVSHSFTSLDQFHFVLDPSYLAGEKFNLIHYWDSFSFSVWSKIILALWGVESSMGKPRSFVWDVFIPPCLSACCCVWGAFRQILLNRQCCCVHFHMKRSLLSAFQDSLCKHSSASSRKLIIIWIPTVPVERSFHFSY